MHKIIEDLNWRYATKKFDPTKKLSEEQLDVIKESLRLVPTSYGLQPLKFLIIENPDIRQKLRDASYNQSPITDASHLIVICSYVDVSDKHVDEYMETIVKIREVEKDSTEGYGNFLKSEMDKMTIEEKTNWNSKQAYIALGQLLHTCANLRVDAIPMEGFQPGKYDEILNLREQNLTATLVCPIGFRAEDDHAQFRKKVRKFNYDLFETI